MTSAHMGRRYIEEALGRMELVRMAKERRRWSTVIREAQESAELFLKGALRLVAVEPAHTHDVADLLRRESARFTPVSMRADRLTQRRRTIGRIEAGLAETFGDDAGSARRRRSQARSRSA